MQFEAMRGMVEEWDDFVVVLGVKCDYINIKSEMCCGVRSGN